MSRSGYSDDCDDNLAYGRWRAQVSSAMRGKRGQSFFKELLAALEGMSDKRLITSHLKTNDGCVCALGAVGAARGLDLEKLEALAIDDEMDNDAVFDRVILGDVFNISPQLAAEIMFINDEGSFYRDESPEQRWKRVRDWAASAIISPPSN